MRTPLDWDSLLFYARLHSVAPLLHLHVKELGADLVPPDARSALLGLYQRAAYQNRIFLEENNALVDAFGGQGIPVIVHKGLSLVELVYGNLARRPLIDLVFLVPGDRVEQAAHVLLERGYRRDPPKPVQALFRWSCPQLIFKRAAPELNFAVILNSTLVTWPRLHRLTPESLWAGTRSASLGGRGILMLSPVDLVLYLCVQVDNNGYFNRTAVESVEPSELLFGTWSNNRLIRFVDIHEVVRHHGGIDWDAFVERSTASGLEDAAHASLSLTNRLLGPIAPDEVLASLRPVSRPRFRGWLSDRVASGDSLWLRLPLRGQIRAAQLIGLAEYAFPTPETFRRLDGDASGLPLPLRYAAHSGRVLARSASGFLETSLAERARGKHPSE
jgi:hypothetical protein